jgi:general secretion pathway protein D
LPQALDTGLSLAVGRAIDGGFNFSLLLRALKSDSDNNILSTPTIVTLDNEEAEIVVGSNVPFVTGQQLSANNDNPFQTIERQDVGLRLKVKPQINEDNTIKLTLEQEVSSVNPTAVNGAVDITTSQRSLKTTVLVDDGQSLVLGGLIDEVLSDSEEKVPLLGDIPIIGNLFRHKVKSKRKTNLVIFLKPNIMRDKKAAIRLSEQHIDKTGIASEIDRRRLGTLYSEGGEIQPNANSQLGEVTWKSMPDGSMQLIKLK